MPHFLIMIDFRTLSWTFTQIIKKVLSEREREREKERVWDDTCSSDSWSFSTDRSRTILHLTFDFLCAIVTVYNPIIFYVSINISSLLCSSFSFSLCLLISVIHVKADLPSSVHHHHLKAKFERIKERTWLTPRSSSRSLRKAHRSHIYRCLMWWRFEKNSRNSTNLFPSEGACIAFIHSICFFLWAE